MEINLKAKRVTLKTAKKYCPEDITVNVSLQDKSVTPGATEQPISADMGYAGLGTVTVSPVATEPGAATPSAAALVVTPSEGKFFSQFTVNATPTEQKTIDTNGTFTPSTGKFFDSITVNVNTAKPEQEKSVDLTKMTPAVVTPDEGYSLSKVTATPKAPLANTADANAAAGDILFGKTAYVNGAKITGTIPTYTGVLRPSKTMPVKGDTLLINGESYRVVKIRRNIAELLALYNATLSQAFGDSTVYAGSALDTYCNQTFYNTLPAAVQNAIVEKAFQQDSWYRSTNIGSTSGNPKYIGYDRSNTAYEVSLNTPAFGSLISRKCYVLSVQDVIDYLEVTPEMTKDNTTMSPLNVRKMFWNSEMSPGAIYAWLRSVYAGAVNRACIIDGSDGCISNNIVTDTNMVVHPSFQIDLNKIDL